MVTPEDHIPEVLGRVTHVDDALRLGEPIVHVVVQTNRRVLRRVTLGATSGIKELLSQRKLVST